MKYVISKNRQLLSVLFSNEVVNHTDLVPHGFKAVSAGFCYMTAFGIQLTKATSATLQLGPNPHDHEIIVRALYRSDTSYFIDFDNWYGEPSEKLAEKKTSLDIIKECVGKMNKLYHYSNIKKRGVEFDSIKKEMMSAYRCIDFESPDWHEATHYILSELEIINHD